MGGPPKELVAAGLQPLKALGDLKGTLTAPRKVFLYIPAGPAVDETIEMLIGCLDPGDIIVDGGNSYWGDSLRRHKKLAEARLHFIDMGTSGGLSGAHDGACFMAGGTDQAFSLIEPILHRLAVEGGVVHAGGPGAGHFVKLVHNGIEFGMLQAIAEGMALLAGFPGKELPTGEILETWRHGSVIRSWLIDLMAEGYKGSDKLEKIPPVIEDTGEVNWLVQDALDLEIPIPVISQSVIQLLASRDDQRLWARAIAVMRHGFGGHPFGRDKNFAKGRKTSRVGDLWRG